MQCIPVPFVAKEVVLPTLRLNEIKQIRQNEDTPGKALITLAVASALRRTELVNILIEDIDWNLKRIKVRTKGGKIGYAPILFAEPYLKAYLDESGKKSGSLFGLIYYGIGSYLDRLEQRARIITGNPNLKTNAHVFRRAFAVICKELGLSDSVIMRKMVYADPILSLRSGGAFGTMINIDGGGAELAEVITGFKNNSNKIVITKSKILFIKQLPDYFFGDPPVIVTQRKFRVKSNMEDMEDRCSERCGNGLVDSYSGIGLILRVTNFSKSPL
jgi:hypothetical protein